MIIKFIIYFSMAFTCELFLAFIIYGTKYALNIKDKLFAPLILIVSNALIIAILFI